MAWEFEPLISQYSHLKDKRRQDEALRTLQKVASLVKPIMRAHNWRVGTLAEFFPPESNLLGEFYIVVAWLRGERLVAKCVCQAST